MHLIQRYVVKLIFYFITPAYISYNQDKCYKLMNGTNVTPWHHIQFKKKKKMYVIYRAHRLSKLLMFPENIISIKFIKFKEVNTFLAMLNILMFTCCANYFNL